MKILRYTTFVVICLALIATVRNGPASAQTAATAAPRTGQAPEVYLLRGFMNVFSLGMDELAEKIQRRGIRAEVYNHMSSSSVVADILAKYRAGHRGPFILIGHSLGASAVVDVANELSQAGVSVDLVIPVDSVTTSTAYGTTKRIVNYYMSNGVGAPVMRGPGFRGRIQNVDVREQGVSHIFIDKSEQVQQLILNQVLDAVRPRPVAPAPAAAGTTIDQSAASRTGSVSAAPAVR